jgi:hypothetical protein
MTKVDGRQIEFTVRATKGAKEVGAGSHSRVVIDVAATRVSENDRLHHRGSLKTRPDHDREGPPLRGSRNRSKDDTNDLVVNGIGQDEHPR